MFMSRLYTDTGTIGPVVISWIAEVPSGYGSPHKSAASMYRHLAQLLKNVKFLDVKM